ncbi:hypothetical protein PIB30_010767 [Stylosanthes scabra]|uniref:PB1 domain-containing protein n=1 Tax=Stylosanthes scabra TaxID=79078 RepID=A0ABU6Y5S1_9FABA|nr:hypothetical protein [Stylosanthes scabra]
MDEARGDSFLTLVHHNGKIKKRTSEGVIFKCDCPTNVFISGGTLLADLQATIERRLGLDARKRVSHIFYRVPVAVVSSGVKYDCFSVESDEDLQVLFHCQQQLPEVRTTELYVEIADVGASSGGSNPHPQPIHVGPTHCPPDVGGPSMARVASSSFNVNLPQGNDDGCDFDDNRSFDELAVVIAAAPQPPSPRMGKTRSR